MLTQVTLKISFPDHFCQGLLPGVSQINAELPQRDESKGIWPALTGDCIVGDSTEPPGAVSVLSTHSLLSLPWDRALCHGLLKLLP